MIIINMKLEMTCLVPKDILSDPKSIEGYVSIQIVPKNPGIVLISGIE